MKEPKFTVNDQRIMEEVRRIVDQGDKLTCAQIAQRLNMAPSSIIKLAQKLGFSGWNDMFYSLSQQYSEEVPLSIDNMDFFGDGRLFEKIRQLLDLLQQYKGSCIVVACVGDSEFLTDYLLDMLCQREYQPCRFSNGLLRQLRDGQTGPGLCLFVNESGIAMYDAGGKLEEAGWKVIAVTSSSDTPLAGIASCPVEIRNRKSPVDSYMPNFFAARVLIFLKLLFAEMDEREKKPFRK